MPELPEVEVTRLSFADRIAGARIESVRQGKPCAGRWAACPGNSSAAPSWRAAPRQVPAAGPGRGPAAGAPGHVRQPAFTPQAPEAGAHDHFDLVTDLGVLRLNDPRRFGAVVHAEGEDAAPRPSSCWAAWAWSRWATLRPDRLPCRAEASAAPIKQVLLAGDVVVGVGNIYASEALFLAGIRPTLPPRASAARARASCTPRSATCWPAR
jgi:formamidopyrimidine-DNA glycosylase